MAVSCVKLYACTLVFSLSTLSNRVCIVDSRSLNRTSKVSIVFERSSPLAVISNALCSEFSFPFPITNRESVGKLYAPNTICPGTVECNDLPIKIEPTESRAVISVPIATALCDSVTFIFVPITDTSDDLRTVLLDPKTLVSSTPSRRCRCPITDVVSPPLMRCSVPIMLLSAKSKTVCVLPMIELSCEMKKEMRDNIILYMGLKKKEIWIVCVFAGVVLFACVNICFYIT